MRKHHLAFFYKASLCQQKQSSLTLFQRPEIPVGTDIHWALTISMSKIPWHLIWASVDAQKCTILSTSLATSSQSFTEILFDALKKEGSKSSRQIQSVRHALIILSKCENGMACYQCNSIVVAIGPPFAEEPIHSPEVRHLVPWTSLSCGECPKHEAIGIITWRHYPVRRRSWFSSPAARFLLMSH